MAIIGLPRAQADIIIDLFALTTKRFIRLYFALILARTFEEHDVIDIVDVIVESSLQDLFQNLFRFSAKQKPNMKHYYWSPKSS